MKKIFPFILILLFDIQLFAGSIIKGKIVDILDQIFFSFFNLKRKKLSIKGPFQIERVI